MNGKTYYITTPIYYPSQKLHIGNTYTSVAADAMARYKKLRGYDVRFLTGTDEHGQKIERIALEKGTKPIEYVNGIVEWIKDLWEVMDVKYDDFIRTTEKRHMSVVQKAFRKLYDQGDIYKSEYDGLYCTPCETFFTERQLQDGKCPDCGRPVEHAKEESYFFKMSKYEQALLKHIEENPQFIQPETRKNEMIGFIKQGLEDLCVSRTSFKWGIPVDFDTDHVVYVWMDALTNYISALGAMGEDETLYSRYWPADCHLVGKDILRFHTIIWPALLMALGQPLPKQVFGHGWLLFGEQKMSKSKGNIVDPKMLVARYGVDAVRYFLLREISFGHDGSFTNEALLQRINSDLANDFGNLVSRTVGMIEKYFDGQLPAEKEETEFDKDIRQLTEQTIQSVEKEMDEFMLSNALSQIWVLVRRLNKYIDETQPWILAKDQAQKAKLSNVLYVLCEGIRKVTIMIQPYMTKAPEAVCQQMGIQSDTLTWDSLRQDNILPGDLKVQKGGIIFPRLDIDKEIEELNIIFEKQKAESQKSQSEHVDTITIDDFAKVKLCVGEIIKCEPVPKADKLLVSQIQIGNETKQIVSGIGKHYKAEEMIGKKVAVVMNLTPVKLRGVLSEGMILAASNQEGELSIITVDKDIAAGSTIQ